MQDCAQELHRQAVAQAYLFTIFVSLELSPKKWLVTVLLAGRRRFSKHPLKGGDVAGLLALFERLKARVAPKDGSAVKIVSIQEAGLDGFWLHRLLEEHGVESQVVDAASIAVPRRHRRAKTDKIDGDALLRTLLAFKRGEPRVCSMVVAPTSEEEDLRRVSRERESLIVERVKLSNRVKGLFFNQGISGYEPVDRDRRERLEELRTGDGRRLPVHLKNEIGRLLERLELLIKQIAAVEAERAALIRGSAGSEPLGEGRVALLMRLKGIGPNFASVIYLEGLYRRFSNRRQLAAYCGLAPTPWRSGKIEQEQGISKAGNRCLRKTMIEAAWFWLLHQPSSQLSRWFDRYVNSKQGRRWRRIAIVALARKLLIALWRFVTQGVIPEGAILRST